MRTRDEITVEGAIITLVSGWEFFALTTAKLPTVSYVVRNIPSYLRLGLVAATAGWFYKHMGPWEYTVRRQITTE